MKEHPIPFTGENVRAILDGRKSQTRRVIKPQPEWDYLCDANDRQYGCLKGGQGTGWIIVGGEIYNAHTCETLRCPYGVPGSRLYVKESFRVTQWYGGGMDGWEPVEVQYKVDGHISDRCDVPETHWDKPTSRVSDKFHSGRFMPRWASRIALEVVNVRVERVQEISEGDSEAEGIMNKSGLHLAACHHQTFHPDHGCGCGSKSLPEEFAALWDTINAKRGYSWESNPWVWVVEFKVAE